MSYKQQACVEELFHGALELATEDRAGYLDHACGHDTGLRTQLEHLLAADRLVTPAERHAPIALIEMESPPSMLTGTVVSSGLPHTLHFVLQPGDVLADRYTIQHLAASGGMGAIYQARDPAGRVVAVKLMHRSRADVAQRFTREARVLTRLRHPAIVTCVDAGVTECGDYFLVMEWLDGVDLQERVLDGAFSVRSAVQLTTRIARALIAAHDQGIVHRDVKPSNIYLPGERVERAKLLDFGVAHWACATRLTHTGMQIGTPSYMAPEQICGASDITGRADVFALGCVLYECLTGEPAFVDHHPLAIFYKILVADAPDVRLLAPHTPAPVASLITRMLAKSAHERPTARDVEAELADSLTSC